VERFEQRYVQCLRCAHVWNPLFDWQSVPYGDKPNRMFNRSSRWSDHLRQLCASLLERLPAEPTVVEIGCGDGGFLSALAETSQGLGTFLGFDPSGDVDPDQQAFQFSRSLFEPLRDVPRHQPDLIVMRHIIEHLTAPSSFLHSLAWAASECPAPTLLYCEVPCIDRVFETGRIADFYYEHPSQFTTSSFDALLAGAGRVIERRHAYGHEVLCGLVELEPTSMQQQLRRQAARFQASVPVAIRTIREQISQLRTEGKQLALWGGTGKAAAFLHHYGITAADIPLVVDSDPRKHGTYVPGVGQEILPVETLLRHPVDVVIIPSQWRARDIWIEATALGLSCESVLIEHGGRLVDLLHDEHPYH